MFLFSLIPSVPLHLCVRFWLKLTFIICIYMWKKIQNQDQGNVLFIKLTKKKMLSFNSGIETLTQFDLTLLNCLLSGSLITVRKVPCLCTLCTDWQEPGCLNPSLTRGIGLCSAFPESHWLGGRQNSTRDLVGIEKWVRDAKQAI